MIWHPNCNSPNNDLKSKLSNYKLILYLIYFGQFFCNSWFIDGTNHLFFMSKIFENFEFDFQTRTFIFWCKNQILDISLN